MAITPLPPAPLPTDTPTEFNAKAFDLVAALEDFVTEANAQAAAVDADATAADADAATATTQAGVATTQAGIATTKAGEAANSASAALTSANNAAASYDAFDDRYLGAKGSDPSVDNDGNALLTGALYWNTGANEMRVYSGSAWIASYLPASSYVVGPSSATANNIALFDGTTGKLIKDSAKAISDLENYAAASQAEMEAGTESALRSVSPLRVKQAITALASGGFTTMEIVTSSTTWTIPAGVTKLKMTVVGGGGHGGGGNKSFYYGGGGGGGAAIKYLTGITPGNTLAVTIGSGGGGTSSVASGTETISTVSATGGGNGANPAGGAGGSGSGGTINCTGSAGMNNGGGAGNGGNSIFGGGGLGGYYLSYDGGAGGAYGGGGGGASYKSSGGDPGGGGGYQGVVVFEY